MDWALGLVGTANMKSSGPIGSFYSTVSTAIQKQIPAIRVFDVAIADTSGAVGNVKLFDNWIVGGGTGTTRVISIDTTQMYLHSGAGYRFPNGCYVTVTGCTASVNFIAEF